MIINHRICKALCLLVSDYLSNRDSVLNYACYLSLGLALELSSQKIIPIHGYARHSKNALQNVIPSYFFLSVSHLFFYNRMLVKIYIIRILIMIPGSIVCNTIFVYPNPCTNIVLMILFLFNFVWF